MPHDRLPDGFHLRLLPPRHVASGLDYQQELSLLQRFRGAIYAEDAAVPSHDFAPDGRHIAPGDEACWHLYFTNPDGAIIACLRLAQHMRGASPADLYCYACVNRMSAPSRHQFRAALQEGFTQAATEQLRIGEVGGWALAHEARRSTTTILLPLACWSLYGILGHSLVFSTATHRHRSAHAVLKLGGYSLTSNSVAMPPFYDPYHDCNMEFIVYHSRKPPSNYAGLVPAMQEWLLAHYPWQDWIGGPATTQAERYGAQTPGAHTVPSNA